MPPNDRYLYKNAMRREFEEYKKTLKCIDCGIQDHRVLDFHHRENNHARTPSGKKYKLATMVATGNRTKYEAEIAKCDVLCANCHAIRRYEE